MSLLPEQRTKYEQCKETVKRCLGTMFEGWQALQTIKLEKLYLVDYATWEAFCNAEFSWTPQWANKYLSAAIVVSQLAPSEAAKVKTVKAAIALSKPPVLPPKVKPEVSLPPKSPAKAPVLPKPPVAPKPPAADPIPLSDKPKDGTGFVLPPGLMPLWGRRQEIQDTLTYISRMRSDVEKAQESRDPLYSSLNFSSVLHHFDNLYSELKTCKPFAVCATCKGKEMLVEGCSDCKGLGLVSQFFYENCWPIEVKEMRAKLCEENNS